MNSKLTNMFAAAMVAATGTAVLNAAQVDTVLVRQQWPWNTEVRVEYVVSGATAPAEVSFTFRNGGVTVPVADATALKGDRLWAGNGTHVVTFNPRDLFGPAAPNEYAAFTVDVTLGTENAAMGDKLYRIVDLETGAVEDRVRGDFYNGKYGKFETDYTALFSRLITPLSDVFIWTDVTNNIAWRTSKMVFRRIPAAAYGSWLMGTISASSGVTASRHLVQLTSDYWMGVFPVTQRQYEILMGERGEYFTNETTHVERDGYPMCDISYNTCRGTTYNWTVDGHQVASSSFIGQLRAKTGNTSEFDLPTEAQWEFASHAGQFDVELYSGRDWSQTATYEVSWNSGNSSVDGVYQVHVVGRKLPNAYGLYDTLGNVWEWCLDWSDGNDYAWTSTETPEVNPQGVAMSAVTLDASGNGNHIARGGTYRISRLYSGCGTRKSENSSSTVDGSVGVRVCCPVE